MRQLPGRAQQPALQQALQAVLMRAEVWDTALDHPGWFFLSLEACGTTACSPQLGKQCGTLEGVWAWG